MKLSIIVPTKNRREHLLVALRSIFCQTEKVDEVIIVDQSSQSARKEVLSLAKKQCAFGDILYFYCPNSVASLIQAKAYATDKATGDVIVFLEDDIEICPGYLQSVRAIFTTNEHLIGGCGVEKVAKISRFYNFFFHLSHLGLFKDPRVGLTCSSASSFEGVASRFLSGGISFFRLAQLKSVGFDLRNDFFALEDIDLSMRVSQQYGRNNVKIFPGVCLVHHRAKVNRASTVDRWSRKVREYIVFYKKFRGCWVDGLSFSWLLACLAIWSVVESASNTSFKPLYGFIFGFIGGMKVKVRD